MFRHGKKEIMALFLQSGRCILGSVLFYHCCCCCCCFVAVLTVNNYHPSSTFFACSLTLQTPSRRNRLQKGVGKARTKFLDWTAEHPKNAILLIDGNNLRGIGKFEYNFVELQNRVACFCHDLSITKSIVVWDHGRCPFARHTSWKAEKDDGFALDMIVLFSGISQRADDVLITESRKLTEIFSTQHDNPNRHEEILIIDWSDLAFVTQDRELNYKLRRQAGLLLDRQGLNSQSGDNDNLSTESAPPLFCDSTRFLELLRNATAIPWRKDESDEKIVDALKEAKESLMHFHKEQRRGYNPRREKTWERVVAAEVYRSFLARQPIKLGNNDTFVKTYLADLETRGYSLTCNEEAGKGSDCGDPMAFVGPGRLDKKQRRSLQRYSKFLQNTNALI